MNTFQRNLLENTFRPYLDSTLVAAILDDGHDFGACFDILSKLAEEANLAECFAYIDGTENRSENDRNINQSSNSEPFNNREDKQKILRHRDKSEAAMYSLNGVHGESSPFTSAELEDRLDSLDLNGDFSDSGSSAQFLKGCFPVLSDEKVNKLLLEYDNSLEKILDVVLNEIFLESEQLDSKSTYSSSASTTSSFDTRDEDYDDDLSSEARFKHRKKKRRRQQKSTQMLLHVNALIPNSDNSTSTVQSSATSSNKPSISEPSSPFTPSNVQNQWIKFEKEIQQLSNSFPTLPHKTIASTLHSNGGNYHETVLKLISICPAAPYCKQQLFNENLNHLKAVFPNHDEQILKKALIGTGSTQMASSLLLRCYDSGYGSNDSSNMSSPDETDITNYDYFNADKLKSDNLNSERPKNNHFKYERSKKQLNVSRSPFLPNGVQFDHDTGEYVVAQGEMKKGASDFNFNIKNEKPREKTRSISSSSATELMAKRNEAYRKAAVAFRKAKGRNGEGGIAFFYSDEGREYDSQMQQWNLRATRSLIKRDSEANRDHVLLDLHGLTVAEAVLVVNEGLAQWYSKGMNQRSHTPMKPLKIVTGLGNHSPNGVAKLPPAIAQMLARDKWDVVRHQGYFLVRGRQP
ncbi:4728_t:CDS:2 [Ambispora gerdemannii]|uniref:4728_t:CDS:1 n=1 Tax=Ambispora gerdemannii TaxID=144530 RepID=A0A9N8UZK1_9GLOM|nr:4728_t:CDS:2 [Ambispora gerdemannii]